jgi:phosphate transport system permease protein
MNSHDASRWHKRRLRAEQRFRWYGKAALALGVAMLLVLLTSIFMRGYQGFTQTQIRLSIQFDPAALGAEEGQSIASLPPSRYNRLVQEALKTQFPEVTEAGEQRELLRLVSGNSGLQIKRMLSGIEGVPPAMDAWIPASSDSDLFFKGGISEETPESERRLSGKQIAWLKALEEKGQVRRIFNKTFFTQGDSRTPEQAGFLGAMVGSALTLIITLITVFPLGVATAIYLEEFSHKGKLVDIIEVNINNLAAVPSIVFGLLGLAVYISVMGMPRSAPLVGGLTLALMTLPVIIITTRASLKAIPDSIRDAARALGASPLQVVWHHTLPLSMPGIMTGTILGMARAIGETAPLLMIGMVAFVADIPSGFTSPATVMPVQIFLWAGSPEAGFVEKTAAGILVLLVLLLAMNALAIWLRKKFEVRW